MKIAGNYAIFCVDDAEPIKELMPEAKVAVRDNKTYVAVPHTVESMQVMRGLGLDAPPPLQRYSYPGRFKPYAHQKTIVEFMTSHKRAYNNSGLGTGKSMATAWGVDFLMSEGVIRRCLIVAPLSCLERVWGDTLYQNLPHRKFVVLHGSRQARLDLLKTSWDFAVVNYAGMGIIGEHLPQDVDIIVFDELAILRNGTTQLWKEAKKLVTPERWAWGLTGTPTPNAPTDAWAQCKLLTPERYPYSFTRCKNEMMLQCGPFKWIPRARSEELVNQMLQPSIRFALEDCIDLPETIYQERAAELSREQKQAYLKLQKECVAQIRGTEVNAVNAGVLLNKLLQVSVGCCYGSDGEVVEIDFGPRYSVIEECIEEAEGKVIIFVPLTGALNAVKEKLKKRWTVEVVDGGVSAGKRNKIFSAFSEEKNPHILLAHPQCMSHGLNLHQQCSTTIWAAPIASNDIFRQANARTVRPGQRNITNIIYIAATPVEHKLYKVLQERENFQARVLSLLKEL